MATWLDDGVASWQLYGDMLYMATLITIIQDASRSPAGTTIVPL